MKVKSVLLERFGSRTNLRLEALSDQLNIICGPPASGKTTIHEFIRWIFYGDTDGQLQAYRTAGASRVRGALVCTAADGKSETIQREDDGTPQGRLIYSAEPHYHGTNGHTRVSEPALPLSLSTFRHIHCVRPESATHIDAIFAMAQSSGLSLAAPVEDPRRLAELRERRNQLQQQWNQLRPSEFSLSGLWDRRRALQQSLRSLVDSPRIDPQRQDRLRDWAHRRDRCLRRYERVRAAIQRIDQLLHRRTQFLTDSRYQSGSMRQRWLDHCRQRLQQLDQDILRWQSIAEQLQSRILDDNSVSASHRLTTGATQLHEDPQAVSMLSQMLLLESQHLAEELRALESTESQDGTGRYLRSVVDAMGRLMQEDLPRWCRAVEHHHHSDHELGAQMGRRLLQRSHQELLDLCAHWDHRRQRLHQTIQAFESYSSADLQSTSGDFDLHVRWRQAIERLEQRRDDLRRLETKFRHRLDRWHARLGRGEAHSGSTSEHTGRIHDLRQELTQIERTIRDYESRDSIRRELQRLDHEIGRLESLPQSSSLLTAASDLLRRMSDGQFTRLSSRDHRELYVEDNSGHVYTIGQLPAVGRDRVALSLCLAVAAAHKRQGGEMPVLLDGWFDHSSPDLHSATVRVLAEFAQSGHQLLIFTQHESVVNAFARYSANLYRLLQRPVEHTYVSYEPSRPYERHEAEGYEPRFRDAVPVALAAPAHAEAHDPYPFPPHEPSVPSWRPRVDVHTPGDPRGSSWPWPERSGARVDVMASRSTIPIEHRAEPVRYYLNLTDPVVDAPSIGDKSGSLLQDVGIYTVRDLLRADAESVAAQLNQRRISTETIRVWQDQARLVCQIPFLRGHDAQLLVACGVTDPHQLAHQVPDVLLRQVDRLTATKEGKRILRGGSPPDLSEITDWINWSQRSRSLDAA